MKSQEIIIDAEGTILGRLASFAAKKALEGNQVIIVNADKVIISGGRARTINRYSEIRRKGRSHSLKGPKVDKSPFKLVKRAIRGMMPNHRWGIGKEAIEKVIVYNNIPEELKKKSLIKIPQQRKLKFMPLDELAKQI